MCCLFGLLDPNEVLSRRQRTKMITALSRAAEVRGTDATGISYVNHGRITIFKRPLPAHQLHFHLPHKAPVIMGHTRLTTQGSEKHSYNNHPFLGKTNDGTFSLAHNGVLHNDARLRQSRHLPQTHIETDSYILVQLLESHLTLDCDSLKRAAEAVEGSFTFTVLDQHNTFYVVKGDSPFCLYHLNGFYLYASTEEILKRALKKLGLWKAPCRQIPISCGEILKIDTIGTLSFAAFDTANIRKSNDFRWFLPYSGWSVSSMCEYEEELLNYANCCGVSQEDVVALLDYGYDTDTIEELLYNPALLETCMDEMRCGFRY